jgi:putative membrane protein
MSAPLQPTINALLNAASAALLATGYLQIRRGRRQAHRLCMLGAMVTSGAFLVSYLVYHAQVGSVRFQGVGPRRPVYFAILISHSVLAVVNLPLVVATLHRALRQRFDAHRRLARVTLPIWGYVSISGVVVYWMLYWIP